ncbi:MAG: YbjN domain-containing protein [Cytophagales bacterium]|nr:YbjN domain-containing protein [Bernardetiaceae bacterium]MDW8210376.1 YbjN domain-containing protein [Cytophagales bacterium]
MLDLTYYYNVVENAISELGVNPSSARTKKAGQWDLRKGSASVWINVLLSSERKDYGYLQIMSPLMRLPSAEVRATFFEELLRLNHQLYGVAFSVYEGWVYLRAIRELEGLSKQETLAMLKRIGTYADEYDDYFKRKYGRQL